MQHNIIFIASLTGKPGVNMERHKSKKSVDKEEELRLYSTALTL